MIAGLVLLFFWLLFGDFAWQLKERSVTATAQLFLKKFDASDFLVGLLVGSVPAAIGMIVGPVVAVRSDQHRGPWGRRIPFLLIPLPVIVLSMAGLAISPRIGLFVHQALGPQSPGPETCILSAFSLSWLFFELSTVVANSVFGGLINDVVPRPVIGRFFGLFRAVSLIDGIIFNFFIIKHAEEHFFWIFVGGGVFYGAGFALMCLMVKEGEYPPPEPLTKTARPGQLQGLRSYLRECFAQPYYLWVFAALILGILAFGPVNAFSIFYAKSLGISMETYGRYIAASYVCSLAMAYFLGSLADRFHPLRLGIVFLALYSGFMIWGAVRVAGAGDFGVVFMAHTILSGAYLTATASIGQRLYPKMKFAQFASAQGLGQAACNAVLPPIVGILLDWSGHQYRITFLMSATLGVLGLLGLIEVHRRFMQLGGPLHYAPPHVPPPRGADNPDSHHAPHCRRKSARAPGRA